MSFLQTLAMDATSLSPATMIVALGLLAPALIAAYQFFQKPSFYSASTTFALLLVFVGYASTVFVGLQTSNHHAYLVAFSTSSLGACSLIIVTALNLHRLLKHLQSSSGQYLRLFWASPQTALNCIAVLQTMALAFFGLSVVYASNLHSSSPIVGAGGALARVYAELRAIAAAKYAHISQSTTLVGILLVSLATWRYAPGPVERTQPSAEGWKRTALNNAPIVTAYATTVLLMRSILLIIKGEGNPAALLDVMPMSSFASGLALACTTAACWAIMYQSSLLSEIEEVVETEQSRWIRDEKTGSLC